MQLTKLLMWLAGLVVLLIIVSFFAEGISQQPAQTVQSSSGSGAGIAYVPPQPPATAADTVAAQESVPFQFLVAYTDAGFQPATITIKKGDTVRFTDNSHSQLWVAAGGSALYPAGQNGCGSSALDSCAPLSSGEFWQFTFTQSGTWTYQNNLDKNERGTIHVE